MSVALGQAPFASESLLLQVGPAPLAEAAQLLGWPTQSGRVRVAFKLGPADDSEPLPTQTEGVAHHGGHSPAGKPLPDIRESARPLRHSRLAQPTRTACLQVRQHSGGSYTSPLSVLGGPAVCRVGLFR